MNATRIYVMSNGGYTGPRWLCPEHMQARVDAKWSLTPGKSVPHDLTCDDCLHEAPCSNAPVAYAPTRDESRLPAPELVATLPGVAPMKRWSEYMAAKRKDGKKRAA